MSERGQTEKHTGTSIHIIGLCGLIHWWMLLSSILSLHLSLIGSCPWIFLLRALHWKMSVRKFGFSVCLCSCQFQSILLMWFWIKWQRIIFLKTLLSSNSLPCSLIHHIYHGWIPPGTAVLRYSCAAAAGAGRCLFYTMLGIPPAAPRSVPEEALSTPVRFK